jgi:hypothetical protein
MNRNKDKDSYSKSWLITINNPKDKGMNHDKVKSILAELPCVYYVMADEIGEQGTYHTHCYFALSSSVRFSDVKARFPTAHIDMARGTSRENREYVYKLGRWKNDFKAETHLPKTRVEWGEMPVKSYVERRDLERLYDLVFDDYSQDSIIESKGDFVLRLDEKINLVLLNRRLSIGLLCDAQKAHEGE